MKIYFGASISGVFYRNQEGKKLSPIISGNKYSKLYFYDKVSDIQNILEEV